MFNKKYTPNQALQKIKHYCSYQERCHSEVASKLYSFGLRKTEVEETISTLIEEDYLNEERFVTQFAGGKFRVKQWGKTRIKYELKQKKISEYLIKKALKSIDNEDYIVTLKKLTNTKWLELKQEQYLIRITKTTNFLLQRGFEPELIKATIAEIRSKSDDKN